MSPHVSSFVHDLVAMAQATERLPALERHVADLETQVEEYAKQVQALEIRAIERKNEIDELVAKILTAEVARDDAELRFLEVEDNAHHILNQAKDMQAVIGAMITKLDPPKATPEPEVVHEAQLSEAVAEPLEDTSASWAGVSGMHPDVRPEGQGQPVGQSEADPIVSMASTFQSPSAPIQAVAENSDAQEGTIEKRPQPYAGLHYYDHTIYIHRDKWIAGGGTQADYDWRP